MKKLDKKLFVAIISILVFVLFIIGFSVLSSLIQSGLINNIEFSQSVQAILSFIMFLPLLLSLFFLGKFFETRGRYPIARILKFVSIGLFVFSIFQVLLSLFGFYN